MEAAGLDGERLRLAASLGGARTKVVAEAGGWSVYITGVPVAADGPTFDEAIDEMIVAMREYANDWRDRLLEAPNHRDNWALAQLIHLCDDDQLRGWLAASYL